MTVLDTDLAPAAPAPAVEVKGVSKNFFRGDMGFTALSNVDLVIRPGEFVSLVGPSGCGKSTLLRIIGGLLQPTEGEARVDNSPVNGPRLGVGIMFQQPTLFPWRSVLSNTLLPVEVRRKPTAEDRQRAEHLLRLVGLEEFTAHHPRELSGGMQQRAALSRVLMLHPNLLLLDEPFGALDEFTRESLNRELSALTTEAGVSVLLVTHSISEAIFLADRVVAMGTNPGRIVGQVEVPLERPRSMSDLRRAELQNLIFQVRGLLGIDERA